MQNLKLGDFGCAVKIKAHTTMPGELQGFVGTQGNEEFLSCQLCNMWANFTFILAYMAPEVFTRNMSEGHGRAADIWSSGCVIIEMATGKRPWHELESNYQVRGKVHISSNSPARSSYLVQDCRAITTHILIVAKLHSTLFPPVTA